MNAPVEPRGRRTFLGHVAGIASAISIVQHATAHPDANLIRTCAEHVVNCAALNDSDSDTDIDDDQHPLWLAYLNTRNAISAATPVTMEGMRAKALAAKTEAKAPGGREVYDGGKPAEWAWDLVNDLVSGRVAA